MKYPILHLEAKINPGAAEYLLLAGSGDSLWVSVSEYLHVALRVMLAEAGANQVTLKEESGKSFNFRECCPEQTLGTKLFLNIKVCTRIFFLC